MSRFEVLAIGLNLTLLFVFVATRVGNFGSRQKSYYYISLPQQVLLCTAGKMHGNGWQTIVCLDAGTSGQASETDSINSFLPRIMPLTW